MRKAASALDIGPRRKRFASGTSVADRGIPGGAMDRVRKNIDDRRERTDASLDAERESATLLATKTLQQRRLSDLIEHERLIVDQQLFGLRDSADRLLASARLSAPTADIWVAHERQAADEAKRGERETSDAILERERHRLDDAVALRDRSDVRTENERRMDTDQKLSTERHDVDDAVSEFGATQQALSRATLETERNQGVLAMVTHELSNPLRMTRLLSDLLDGAHIDAGTFRVVPAPHDIGALLQEIRTSYMPLFEARQLSFTVDSPSPPAGLIAFDHDRIVQVLSNLLSNAMKFTPAQGTVGLCVRWQDDGVEFAVRDNGPGIATRSLPNVFERFWQARTASREGLGLGLYICKTIVEAHAGRIGVESEYGHGATFRFTLPRLAAVRPTAADAWV
jgi:signal transduction histidine kinase